MKNLQLKILEEIKRGVGGFGSAVIRVEDDCK